MEAWWVTLLRAQQSDGFRDVAGAEASATIPISDQLITRLIAQRLPPTAPVREVSLVAHAGNEVTVRLRLSKPAILPPLQVRLAIVEQPALPASPVLTLALVSQGLANLAVTALSFVDRLPPGIRFDGRRLLLDLRTLLEARSAGAALNYLTDLSVTTTDRHVVVHARASLPPA